MGNKTGSLFTKRNKGAARVIQEGPKDVDKAKDISRENKFCHVRQPVGHFRRSMVKK